MKMPTVTHLRQLLTALLLGAVFALTGCIYENPVAQPSQKIDTAPLGFWKMKSVDDDEDTLIDVAFYRFSETEYLIMMTDEAGDFVIYRGYPFSVDGKTYLQVQWLETENPQNPDSDVAGSYMVFDMAVQGDKMTLAMMGYEETEASSADLKKAMQTTAYDDLFIPVYEATRTDSYSIGSKSDSSDSSSIVGYWGLMQDDTVILRWLDSDDGTCMTFFGREGDDFVIFSDWSLDSNGVLTLSDIYTGIPTLDGGTRDERILDEPIVSRYQTSINSDGYLVMELIEGEGVSGTLTYEPLSQGDFDEVLEICMGDK